MSKQDLQNQIDQIELELLGCDDPQECMDLRAEIDALKMRLRVME